MLGSIALRGALGTIKKSLLNNRIEIRPDGFSLNGGMLCPYVWWTVRHRAWFSHANDSEHPRRPSRDCLLRPAYHICIRGPLPGYLPPRGTTKWHSFWRVCFIRNNAQLTLSTTPRSEYVPCQQPYLGFLLLHQFPPTSDYICDKANETTLNRSTTNPFSVDNVGVEFLVRGFVDCPAHPYLLTLSPAMQPGGYYRVPGGVAAPQLSCLYASASMILPDPASSLGLYLPTYMEVVNETIEQGCEGYSTPACDSWITLEGSRHRYYIPDLRWYLININHGFTSSVGIAKSSQDISGQLLDRSGRAMDLCASYHKHALPCPPEVSTSLVSGSPTDFLPVQALLNAAGIESFDVRGGGDCGGLYDSTPRSSGLSKFPVYVIISRKCVSDTLIAVLTISIDYSNSFLSSGKSVGTSVYDDDYVKYSYRVRAGGSLHLDVPFKNLQVHCNSAVHPVPKLPYATTQVISEDYFPANHRQVKKSTGIRIIFEQTGISS